MKILRPFSWFLNAVVTFDPATLEAGKVFTFIAMGTLDDTDAFDFGVMRIDDTGSGDALVDLTVAAP